MGGVGTIDMQFVGWNQIPSCGAKTQFVYWENQGLMLDAIISGAQDSVIRNFAAHVCPGMYLSVFHEMNGNWDTWDGTIGNNTPTKVIQAYRHIHDIIGNKVIWAWVVNNISVPNWAGNQIADYWPGSAYVDITGVDAFTYSGESFAQAVPPTLLATLNTFGKPVWITSIGTNHDKNAWVKDMMAKLPSTGVKGVLYFNYAEWQLDSATLSLIH
jgi:beta-mannanase